MIFEKKINCFWTYIFFKIWRLVCEEDGAYSIENYKYQNARLANVDSWKVKTHNGNKYEDQVNKSCILEHLQIWKLCSYIALKSVLLAINIFDFSYTINGCSSVVNKMIK